MDLSIETAAGTEHREIDVQRVINLGSATREATSAIAHQEEVAKEGVRIAFDIPAPRLYPVASWALTSATSVGVQGPQTSGEVEIVVIDDGDIFVTVGSDHTDRDLERTSILWSKQACPNVIARTGWRWDEVADHWDSLLLECDVDGRPYQRVGVDVFLSPTDVLRLVRERADVPERGLVVYCGTYVSVGGELSYGSTWTTRLIDPTRRRTISHEYRVEALLDEVHEPFRVPLQADGG